MNNLKYIKGDDPACYRGEGRYLVIASPNDNAPTLMFKAGGSPFFPNDYYAGPINPEPPDPPPTKLVVAQGKAAWKGPGLYVGRSSGDINSSWVNWLKMYFAREEMMDGNWYAGPFAIEMPQVTMREG